MPRRVSSREHWRHLMSYTSKSSMEELSPSSYSDSESSPRRSSSPEEDPKRRGCCTPRGSAGCPFRDASCRGRSRSILSSKSCPVGPCESLLSSPSSTMSGPSSFSGLGRWLEGPASSGALVLLLVVVLLLLKPLSPGQGLLGFVWLGLGERDLELDSEMGAMMSSTMSPQQQLQQSDPDEFLCDGPNDLPLVGSQQRLKLLKGTSQSAWCKSMQRDQADQAFKI
mmetsp:Transcript_15574/g.34042  ORF Transcript_15574/g.34042 Transcript_15574/m.34042 type:complete len:225 (-) Transcript_15574:123-797(-)